MHALIKTTLFFIMTLGISCADEPPPKVLFGAEGTYDLTAIQPKDAQVAVSFGRLEITGLPGVFDRRVVLKLDAAGEDLSAWRYIEADVVNRGTKPLVFTFWAMSGLGWGGVSTFSVNGNKSGYDELEPGESATIQIDIHARYPGKEVYTPAINPASVRWLEFVFGSRADAVDFSVGEIRAVGKGLPPEPRIAERILVPDAEIGDPAPGRRVFRTIPNPLWSKDVQHVITLPTEWKPGEKYPVIVEYPGSYFFHKHCYSTGRTQDAHLGYGLARGEKYIVLNLPFITSDGQHEQVSGWGDINLAVTYCLTAVKETIEQFGGDPEAIIYTGFSRGDYAANYLALRTPEIAALWRGFLTSKNPGLAWGADNVDWNNVRIGWDERAARMNAPWFNEKPNLGAGVHADVYFLQDSPSTIATREWLARLVSKSSSLQTPPPTTGRPAN